MAPRLLPTPKSSPYVEQYLSQPVTAFGKKAQNAQFGAQLASALAQAYGAYRDRKKQRTTQDALTEAIVASQAPSGWVNPDVGLEPGFAQLPSSDVTRGAIPADMRRLGAETAAVASGGRYDPTGGPVVPITPFRPEDAILEDDTQIRGRESILNALLTDERLRDLGPEDITLAQKMTLDDLIQRKPRILTAKQLKQFGYAPDAVVQVSPDGTHNVVQTPQTVAKKGQPKEVRIGPALDANGKQIIVDGEDQFNWGVFQDGELMTGPTGQKMKFVAGEKGGINLAVKVGDETDPWVRKFQELSAADASGSIESAARMGQDKQTIDEMLSFFDNPEFTTGKVEEFILPLKQWAIGLGVSINKSDMASKEAFVAKAKQLVLKQVEFMKGALSNKELTFLEEQVAGLGKSPGGNKLILWLARMSMDKMGQFAQFARSWTTEDGRRFGDKGVGAVQWNDMKSDWENTDIYNQDPRDYIMGLAYADEDKWTDEGVPEAEIADRLENRYSLSLINQIFVEY
jgi:hypothetical protein